MRRYLLAHVALLVPAAGPGMAQTADAVYCARLAELVIRYTGKQINGQNRPDSESLVAIDRCDHGDTASGIPVLEKKLLEARFTLPPR
jgi:hypothetical protein